MKSYMIRNSKYDFRKILNLLCWVTQTHHFSTRYEGALAWVKNKSFLNSLHSRGTQDEGGKLAAHSIIFGVSFFNP